MDALFEPIMINKTQVKNRFYMTAMHLNMCENNEVTDRICAFYAERAKGGAGLICVGFVTIDSISGMGTNIGAHDDKFLPGLKKLADAVKDNGSLICAQINHAGRQLYSFVLPKGEKAIGPSAIKSNLTGETPREMTEEQILEVIDSYAKCAARLKKTGFDAVELLMGTGYLVSAFLSPLANQRTDKWGGSEENRMRFGIEVLKAVRGAVGPDFPILARINGNDLVENGLGSEPHLRFAQALEAAGIDALCVNVGWHEAKIPQITMGVPRCNFAYMARRIKEKVKIPVIASHRINEVDDARTLIELGYTDMAGMGRALIADPYLPMKAQQDREEEITHCVACGQGCFDHVFLLQAVECMVNPEAGHELMGPIEKAPKRKKVAVIGGGAAGMSAALAANKRGHKVTLFEKEEFLGGQLLLAAAPPGREEIEEIVFDMEGRLDREGVEVKTATEVTAKSLLKGKYDAVVLATGAKPLKPPIPGIDGPSVIDAWDYLSCKVEAEGKVVVVGGGAVGVETALALAEVGTLPAETLKFILIHGFETPEELRRLAVHGTNEVTLVEMLPKVGKEIGKSTRWTMLGDLTRYGVGVLTKTKVLEITPLGVVVEGADGKKTLPADWVVVAVGSKSYNPLQAELEGAGLEVKTVGDAGKVGLAFDAIHSGYKVGREL